MFSASWVVCDGIPVVTVVGEVDITTAPQLDATLCDVRDTDPFSVILSLESCTYLDSSGISVLLRHSRRTPNFVVVSPGGSNVRRVLRVSGIDGAFDVVEDEEAALALAHVLG